jgi:hypothetical protein
LKGTTSKYKNYNHFFLGEPETDYPIFNIPPETAFTCDGKATGMYADVEARCQVPI